MIDRALMLTAYVAVYSVPVLGTAAAIALPATEAEAFLTKVVCTWKHEDAIRFFMRNGRSRDSAEFILGVERVNRCSEGK